MNDLTAPVEELPKRLEVATKRQERSRNQLVIVFALLLIVALSVAGISLQALTAVSQNSVAQQKANGEKIDDLTQQLAAANGRVLEQLNTKDEKAQCAAAYGRLVATSSAKYLQAVGQVSLAIANFQPGTPERAKAAEDGTKAANAADTAQQSAFDAQTAWFAGDEPLPCNPEVLKS